MEINDSLILVTPDQRTLDSANVAQLRSDLKGYTFSGIGNHAITQRLINHLIGTDFIPFRFGGDGSLLMTVRTWPYKINGQPGYFDTSVRLSIVVGFLDRVQMVEGRLVWAHNWSLDEWRTLTFSAHRLEITRDQDTGDPLRPPDHFKAERFTYTQDPRTAGGS